jgi:hypothetical protein
MEKKRKLASFKLPKQTTILSFKKKMIEENEHILPLSHSVVEIDSVQLSPRLLHSERQSPKLLSNKEEYDLDEENMTCSFRDKIVHLYNLDQPIEAWPKYTKHKDRYFVERIRKNHRILLESIPIHRNLQRLQGYAQWIPETNHIFELNTNEDVPYDIEDPNQSETETIDLTIIDTDINAFTSQNMNQTFEGFYRTMPWPHNEHSPAHSCKSSKLFKNDFVKRNRDAVICSDPVSIILDELFEEEIADPAFDQYKETAKAEVHFKGVMIHSQESEDLIPDQMNPQYAMEYREDYRMPDIFDDVTQYDLFESIPGGRLHTDISSSPIAVIPNSAQMKMNIRKALFPKEKDKLLSSSQDFFQGYGLGSSALNINNIPDHTESQEPESFINLKKAKQDGKIEGLENYFNQFEPPVGKKQKSKGPAVAKPKKSWKGKSHYAKTMYKRR